MMIVKFDYLSHVIFVQLDLFIVSLIKEIEINRNFWLNESKFLTQIERIFTGPCTVYRMCSRDIFIKKIPFDFTCSNLTPTLFN